MKKVLVFVLALVIIGGAGFFFGWTQLQVPPGSFGVLRTKTHGLDPEVIREGEFRWLWYKLIPTNASVSTFTLPLVIRPITSSGSLGSGSTFAALAGVEADFSWELSGELSFSIKPESLPALVVRENISTNEELRQAEARLAERITNFILQRLRSLADSADTEKFDALRFAGSLPELDKEVLASFADIENFMCTINVVSFPDFTLYRSLAELYREYMQRQAELLSPGIALAGEGRLGMNLRLDELARYGELLSRYPILLQFLALERGFPPAGNVLEQ